MLIKLENIIFFLLILFLPTQLGKHFWPEFSIVSGIRVDYLSPTLYFTDILIFLLFIFWAINHFKKTRKTQKASNIRLSENLKVKISGFPSILSVPKIYLLLLAFLLLNIFLSGNITSGFHHLLKLLEFSFIGFYFASQINTFGKLQEVVLLLAASAIGQSLLAILQFLNQGSLGSLFYFLGERSFNPLTPGIANASINGELLLRPYATFPHPNVLAGFLLCVMILSLWLFKALKKNWQRLIVILCLLLGTGALILTMSRVAIVLWVCVLLLSAIVSLRGAKRQSNLMTRRLPRSFQSLAMTTALIFLILTLTPFGPRLLSTRLTEEAVVQRQELITSSFKLFAQSPVVGVGLGNSLRSLAAIQRPLSSTLYIQPVHNIFLLTLTETGMVGFSFFVWFLIKTYRYLFRNLKTHAVFLLVLTVILALGFFDHYFLTLQQGQLFFSTVLGLCWTRFDRRT